MKEQVVDLGFVKHKFDKGTHACLIYNDDDERERIMSQFLNKGLENNERVSYFALKLSKEELLASLKKKGVILNEENLEVFDAKDVYYPDGKFDMEHTFELLGNFYRETVDRGFKNSRLSGEMVWVTDQIENVQKLMEYESKVNEFYQINPVTAVCQYDARKFSGEIIAECLKVHPYVIINGQIIENPYYVTTAEYMKQKNGD